VPRDDSSGHRRYGPDPVRHVESLACPRSAGRGVEVLRRYLDLIELGRAAATEQRELFASHAERLDAEIVRLEARRRYLRAKAELWSARENDDPAGEARAIAALPALVDGPTR
jgi:DNA-binding transcriptional MerR regulator